MAITKTCTNGHPLTKTGDELFDDEATSGKYSGRLGRGCPELWEVRLPNVATYKCSQCHERIYFTRAEMQIEKPDWF